MAALELRPLSLGEILDRTFSLYRAHFSLFIGIAAIPNLLVLVISLIQVFSQPPTKALGSQMRGSALGVAFLAILVSIFVYLFSQGGTILALTDVYLGRPASISGSLRRVSNQIGSLFGAVVLNGLAIAGATLLFIIPGIYLACRLLVYLPSATIERLGPGESLSRSFHLTRGNAGRAFLIGLLTCVLIIGVSALTTAPLTYVLLTTRNPATIRLWSVLSNLASTCGNILVGPIFLIATSLFYFDLRVRKEAFDLQFMMDPHSEGRAGPGSVPSVLS